MPIRLTRSELAAYAVCCLLVVLLGWRVLRSDARSATAAPAAQAGTRTDSPSGSGTGAGGQAGGATVSAAPARDTTATVHVVGAVRRAGVYRLRLGDRVQDAIRRAGGATPWADLQAINLAAKLADGEQVVVPRKAAAGAAGGPAVAPAGAAGAAGATPGGSGAAPAAPVNLNSATVDQLDTLDGVGPATAQKIIAYRTEHGGFSSVDDLGQVSGIGPKRLEALRAQVTV